MHSSTMEVFAITTLLISEANY